MAYMNQERKAEIATALHKVIPYDWKWSLSVRHHSTIVLTIQAAPVDLVAEYNRVASEHYNRWNGRQEWTPETHPCPNEYHLEYCFDGELLALFERIKTAMNRGNHDNSDPQTDYFDVGWYIDIKIGSYDKPFVHLKRAAAPLDTGRSPQPGEPEYEALKAKLAELQAKLQPKAPPKSDLAHCWHADRAEC